MITKIDFWDEDKTKIKSLKQYFEKNISGADVRHFDGFVIYWNENNLMSSKLEYKNWKRDGVCKWWYKNGQPRYEDRYKDGKVSWTL